MQNDCPVSGDDANIPFTIHTKYHAERGRWISGIKGKLEFYSFA